MKGPEIHSYHDRGLTYNDDAWHRACRHGLRLRQLLTQIGRIEKSLDELGLRKNTVVVLWGDHGYIWANMTFGGNTTPCTSTLSLIVFAPVANPAKLDDWSNSWTLSTILNWSVKPSHSELEGIVSCLSLRSRML